MDPSLLVEIQDMYDWRRVPKAQNSCNNDNYLQAAERRLGLGNIYSVNHTQERTGAARYTLMHGITMQEF